MIQVLEIVSSHGNGSVEMPKYVEPQPETRSEKNTYGALVDFSQKIYQLLHSQYRHPIKNSNSNERHKVKYRQALKLYRLSVA